MRGMFACSIRSASNIWSTHLFMNWRCGGFIGRWCTVVRNVVSSGMFKSICAPGIGSTSLSEHANTSANSVSSLVISSHCSLAVRLLLTWMFFTMYSTRSGLNRSVFHVNTSSWLLVFSFLVFSFFAGSCVVLLHIALVRNGGLSAL
ncbi:hypothetical protein EDD17DRAFT_1087850 [Pisolithus thermaeus]|nr:hypothetical protein EDD17DRAFT_1087850 [Pisolithus thermaeus]